ncbi:hypothetical protein HMPREF3232_00832 [Fannyhessea vaginae]|uniref:Uncharacterized protein n=1 Tax=Fannyhessea vaginae DSM 15829 TaxID=525256 RepID=F1T609_9ACTN|nr:hypothetical protein HMPREF0091_10909 [Fannyhessea vaginae DSM 15829]KXG89558.1 hypothetical protein HMPREF3232_00832 [Fannyhessea vaginae]
MPFPQESGMHIKTQRSTGQGLYLMPTEFTISIMYYARQSIHEITRDS